MCQHSMVSELKASQDALLAIICSFYRWRVSVWFFKEFRSPLSWMVGAQCSCTAPKHTSFNSCFGIMLQDQPGNIQNAFLHHTTIYAHYVRRHEWANGLKILKLTREGQQNIQIARKRAWIKEKKKPYLMKSHTWWNEVLILLSYSLPQWFKYSLHRELKGQQISIKWTRTFST
jgi:hypothetical protein